MQGEAGPPDVQSRRLSSRCDMSWFAQRPPRYPMHRPPGRQHARLPSSADQEPSNRSSVVKVDNFDDRSARPEVLAEMPERGADEAPQAVQNRIDAGPHRAWRGAQASAPARRRQQRLGRVAPCQAHRRGVPRIRVRPLFRRAFCASAPRQPHDNLVGPLCPT